MYQDLGLYPWLQTKPRHWKGGVLNCHWLSLGQDSVCLQLHIHVRTSLLSCLRIHPHTYVYDRSMYFQRVVHILVKVDAHIKHTCLWLPQRILLTHWYQAKAISHPLTDTSTWTNQVGQNVHVLLTTPLRKDLPSACTTVTGIITLVCRLLPT